MVARILRDEASKVSKDAGRGRGAETRTGAGAGAEGGSDTAG